MILFILKLIYIYEMEHFCFNKTVQDIEMEQNIHTTSKRGRIENIQKGVFGSESKKQKVRGTTKAGQRKYRELQSEKRKRRKVILIMSKE